LTEQTDIVSQLPSEVTEEIIEDEITDRCDHLMCPEVPDKVIMDFATWDDIQELYYRFFPDEFAVYLKGRIDGNTMYINDYLVPLQHVRVGFVEIVDCPPADAIGHLHSHGSFSPFFSSTDIDHLNYWTHIVIGNGEPVAICRWKTSCGHILQRPATFKVIQEN
jgi:hypothetical protein